MVDEPRAKARLTRMDDQNSKIAALVKLIIRYGPQINRISRDLGVHKETTRYWYKEKLLKRGYTFQAAVNHEKLGLGRVIALVEFSDTFKPYADPILMAMSELGYLISFAKTLPEDQYSIHASVPKEYVGEWIELMFALNRKGLFKSVQTFPFEWVRVVPMRTELYDFDGDSWQYDWNAKPKVELTSEGSSTSTGKFDSVDLAIIKQMQINPDASLTELGSKFKINYKTLTWHYRNHIVANSLLKGYYVNWAGTRYDPNLEKALHRRHKYMWLELLVRDVSENERMGLMANISRLPFVWSEAGGSNYYAQIAFPIEGLTEALAFIKESIAPVRSKAIWHFLDQRDALRFTILPELYDSSKKKWMFNQADVLNRFDKLILEIKEKTD